jgi:hypothetical protein
MNANAIPLSESFQRIASLNLEALKFKLVQAGGEWTVDRADVAERQYKRFLMLAAKYRTQKLVPAGDIDAFWHHHILDTHAYSADCAFALGFFLHHWPYSGTMGIQDAQALRANLARTAELYSAEFGESYISDLEASCDSGCHDCDGGGNELGDRARLRPSLRAVTS